MVPCQQCSHYRRKLEKGLRDGGYVKCKPLVDPALWLRAFYNFAANGTITDPFVVSVADAHPRDAWPFQFRPENIAQCAGFSASNVSTAL